MAVAEGAAPYPVGAHVWNGHNETKIPNPNNNSGKIYRLARAYSRSNEDFYAQPHAAISRDGHYVAFVSNMAYAHGGCPANFQSTTGCTEVYVVKVQ